MRRTAKTLKVKSKLLAAALLGSMCFAWVKCLDLVQLARFDACSANGDDSHTSHSITDLEIMFVHATRCLNATHRGQFLRYPKDPSQHFFEVHEYLSEYLNETNHYAAEYAGPWIENWWIAEFGAKLRELTRCKRKLSDVFGPFIPLLIPWVDLWVNSNPNAYVYPEHFLSKLASILRNDVLYITVSQSAHGILAQEQNYTKEAAIQNILVLSAGGDGHVPLPLLKQRVKPCSESHPNSRSLFVSFGGTVGRAPNHLRERMESIANASSFADLPSSIGRNPDWHTDVCNSRFVLCPRGVGRTSYRLAETIQSGRIPIFVHNDDAWIPYTHIFNTFGFSTNVSQLQVLLTHVWQLPDQELTARERRIRQLSMTHFSYEGVLKHIQTFMLRGEAQSDLRCTVR